MFLMPARWAAEKTLYVAVMSALQRHPVRGIGSRDVSTPASCHAAPECMCHADDVPLRCLIVDDNASFLRAAVALFEREGVTVVGVASNGADALRQARELRPDVILVDIVLGRESGFDLARRLFEADPDGAKVILISTHAEVDFADLINKTPVAGFVAKSELSANEIRRVAGADDHA
jgi:CheY-like chemotaxis protein